MSKRKEQLEKFRDLPDELLCAPGGAPKPRENSVLGPENPPASVRPLLHSLQRHCWNVSAAARELGICRATVYRRMQRHGIVPPHRVPPHGVSPPRP